MLHNNRALPRLSISIALQFLLPLTLTVGVFTAATKPSAANEPAPRMRLTQIEVRLLRELHRPSLLCYPDVASVFAESYASAVKVNL